MADALLYTAIGTAVGFVVVALVVIVRARVRNRRRVATVRASEARVAARLAAIAAPAPAGRATAAARIAGAVASPLDPVPTTSIAADAPPPDGAPSRGPGAPRSPEEPPRPVLAGGLAVAPRTGLARSVWRATASDPRLRLWRDTSIVLLVGSIALLAATNLAPRPAPVSAVLGATATPGAAAPTVRPFAPSASASAPATTPRPAASPPPSASR